MEKGGFNFKKFLGGIFYEEATSSEDTTTPTAAQEEAFSAAVSSENKDVVEMARQLIFASQEACDNDELPDISNVMNAVETAGSGENHELIRRMIQNLLGMNPDDLVQDGLNRKEAIKTAIKTVQSQDAALKAQKADDEKTLRQAEADAGNACTKAITDANNACETAIEEVKRRADEEIAALRLKAEEDTAAAKKARDETLAAIAEQRSGNETELRNSAQYAEAVETQGTLAIAKVDELLSYIN